MKLFSLLLIVVAVGCASKPQPRVAFETTPSPAVEPVATVRHPEVIRAYHVGRYVDPHRPGLMHETHPVYRVEAYSHWNLQPGHTTPSLVNQRATHSTSYLPPSTNDVLRAEFNRQREATARVIEEARRLASSYADLERVIRSMETVARDHAALKAKFLEVEERTMRLREEMNQVTSSHPAEPNAIGSPMEP